MRSIIKRVWRITLSDSKSINLILLQYKPEDDYEKSIVSLDRFLSKRNIKKDTLILCPELSLQKYFCINKNKNNFNKAITIRSKTINDIKNIAKKYKVFLCITFFEKNKDKFFNTCVIINKNGNIITKYNKNYIPSESCYHERYYFNNSNNNFKTFSIGKMKIGLMICWDQWHSNPYQIFKKKNVNLIICPTAIGGCYINQKLVSLRNEKEKWLNVITANSLMNNIPVAVSNRIGTESENMDQLKFWGNSFITNAHGDITNKCGTQKEVIEVKISNKEQLNAQKMWNFINKT